MRLEYGPDVAAELLLRLRQRLEHRLCIFVAQAASLQRLGRRIAPQILARGHVIERLYQGRWQPRENARGGAEEHFRTWYLARGQLYVEERVERWAARLEVEPRDVSVRPLGSCAPSGTLNFHWRSVLLPARLVDYVVVHELAHLHEPRHDPSFWRCIERAMPDYRRRKQELAEQGGGYF